MPIPIEVEFEAALAELEQIVEALERGGPDLSAALAGYGRGIALLGACQGLLDNAERSVALLTGVDEAGQPITAPFDAAATAAAANPPAAATLAVEAVAVAVPPPGPAKKSKSAPAAPPSSTIPEAPF